MKSVSIIMCSFPFSSYKSILKIAGIRLTKPYKQLGRGMEKIAMSLSTLFSALLEYRRSSKTSSHIYNEFSPSQNHLWSYLRFLLVALSDKIVTFHFHLTSFYRWTLWSMSIISRIISLSWLSIDWSATDIVEKKVSVLSLSEYQPGFRSTTERQNSPWPSKFFCSNPRVVRALYMDKA